MKRHKLFALVLSVILSVATLSAAPITTYASTSTSCTTTLSSQDVTIAEVTTSSVKLAWGKLKGASSYIVYKLNPSTGKYVKYKTTSSLSCTIKNLSKGKTYSFKVAGLIKKNSKLYVQKKTPAITITTQKELIDSPSISASNNNLEHIRVTGKHSTKLDNGAEYIYSSNITIYRSETPNGTYRAIASIPQKYLSYSYIDSDIVPGKTYYYYSVATENKTGYVSKKSPVASVSIPKEFTYELVNGQAYITSCNATGDITIPSYIDGYKVVGLDCELFYGRNNITRVTIPATVTEIGEWDYVFSYCYKLEEIIVDPANPAFCSVDGVLMNKDKTVIYNYPCGKHDKSYTIPDTVKILCCTSFASSKLTDLYIPSDTTWYTYTFWNNGGLTIHYPLGGRTAAQVDKSISKGQVHSSDSLYPTYFNM